MNVLTIYDPPQSCATGACEPDAVDAARGFDASLAWLAERGVSVARFNLGLDPEAFATNALVRGTLRTEGIAALPLVVMDGEVLAKGRYPTREELASRIGAATAAD